MPKQNDVPAVAQALTVSLSLVVNRFRSTRDESLSLPETSALKRLEDAAQLSLTELARMEGISAQSLGATVAGLEARKLVVRLADPHDGRRTLISITATGRATLRGRRSARIRQMTAALADEFDARELERLFVAAPLLERLARRI